MAEQTSWRYCQTCHMMFYDGFGDKGSCLSGGHVAQGFVFSLPYGGTGSGPSQDKWRHCDKCRVMFYHGYGDGGRCFKGGSHNAQGIVFTLPHSTSASATAQDKWRYCDKCRGMFYEGYPGNGVCPAGGGHNPQGLIFVLPYENVNGSGGDVKWMGVPITALGTVALKEFGEGFRSGASGQIRDDWILDLEAKIRQDPIGFKIGYTIGVLTGLYTGLKNLFGLIVDLFKLSIALSGSTLVIKGGREAFYLLTDESHRKMREAQLQSAQRIAAAAKSTIEDINQNPNDYIVLSREVGEILGQFAGRWFTEDFMKRSAKEIGETIGDLVGQILFEIILQIVIEATTAGLGNAARGGTLAGQGARGGSRVAGMVERLKPLLQRTKGLQRFFQLLIKDQKGHFIIGKLKLLKAIPWRRGRYAVEAAACDVKLLEMVRELRLTQAGLTEEAFREFNVAAAKVRVWESEAARAAGKAPTIEYLDAANIPGKLQHSEGLILDQAQALRKRGKIVVFEQWYTERIPCGNCRTLLDQFSSEASVFYTIGEEGPNRGKLLMKAYGLGE